MISLMHARPGSADRRKHHTALSRQGASALTIAILLTFPAPLSAHAEQPVPTIKAGSEVDFPPYAIVKADGRASGFSVELLEAVTEAMGLSTEIHPGPWPDVLAAFKDGRLDLLPLVALSPQRADMATFSKPHTVAYDSFFVRRGARPIRSLADARGKVVLVMTSDSAHENLVASGLPVGIVETRTIPEAMRLLASGRHDAVLVPKLLGHLVVRDLKLDAVIEAGPPIPDYQRRFAFAVQPGNRDLRDKLDQGIAIVRATGRYDVLYDKWFGAIEPKEILTWHEVLWATGVAVVLILVPLGWSLSLRHQVARRTASLAAEIATRQAVEAALTLSTARYEDLAARIPVGVYTVFFRADGGMLFEYVSPRFCQILDVDADALLADANTAFSRAHPDDRDRLIRDNNDARQTLASFRWEGRFIVHGETRHIRIESDVTPLPGGESRWNGVISDITIRKQTEDALNAELRRNKWLVDALDNVPAYVYIKDKSSRYVYANRIMLELFDCSAEELPGSDDAKFFSGDARRTIATIDEKVFSLGMTIEEEVAVKPRKLDEIRIYWEVKHPIRDADGAICGLCGVSTDITVRKQAEERLRTSEERMRLFFERQIVGMAITSPQKGWIQVNDHLCRMLGYSREELEHLTWPELTHPDDLAADNAQFARLLAQEIDEYFLEKKFITKTGDIVHTDLSVGCVRNRDGSVAYVLALLADITERKKVEAQIAAANRQLARQAQKLEKVNADLKEFAYVASHDLRAPLRTVTSYLGLITRKMGTNIDDDMHEFIDFAVDGAKRMDSMIAGLLEYSRTGRSGIPFEPTSLADVVEESLVNLRVSIQEAGAVVDVAATLPVLTGGHTELVRLFQNLIGNAIKYTVAGRAPRVSVGWRDDDVEWVVWVKDNGMGIDPSNFDRVFEVFRRLVSAEKYEGSGIGLAICRKIVELHGGRIWVESVPGDGSSFLMAFPKSGPSPEDGPLCLANAV